MKSDTLLDYAVFQLSPKRSRCELFVSAEGNTEKLASGLLKPFVTHLKVAEEQVAQALQSIKLQVERRKYGSTWFTKGTLERFVRFVSTPEVLELVNTFNAEMSQLEAARRIYLQGGGDPLSDVLGENETASTAAAADITKKELLRAIDVRLLAVKQDLTAACTRASAAGFTLDNVSELLLFADCFGAHRLSEACSKLIDLCEKRPELINPWKGIDDRNVRSSSGSGSDMSIDDPTEDNVSVRAHQQPKQEEDATRLSDPSRPDTCHLKPSLRRFSREEREGGPVEKETGPSQQQQPARRLSVQDRINLFEKKQKEQSGGDKVVGAELRRLSSDVSQAPSVVVVEKAVLRRWSGASDMSIELNNDKKETESTNTTPSSSSNNFQSRAEDKGVVTTTLNDTATSQLRSGLKDDHPDSTTQFRVGNIGLKDQAASKPLIKAFSGKVEDVGLNDPVASQAQFKPLLSRAGDIESKAPEASETLARAVSIKVDDVGLKDEPSSQTQSRTNLSKQKSRLILKDSSESQIQLNKVFSGKVEDFGTKDPAASEALYRGFSGKSEDAGRGDLLSPPSEWKTFPSKVEEVGNSDLLAPQSQWKAFPGKSGQVGKKELVASQAQVGPFSNPTVEESGAKDSGVQGMKLHKQTSAREQSRRLLGRKDESILVRGNVEPSFHGGKVMGSQEMFDSASTPPIEQVQKIRQSRGNQELNDELQMKANELEKLFAAHKRRVPGDQMASARRSKLADVGEHATWVVDKKPEEVIPTQLSEKTQVKEPLGSSSGGVEFDVNLLVSMVDNQGYGNSSKQKLGDHGLSEDSRGKFYERYMQKRDAKLKEEWGSKRAQKEAKMKAMQDSLESSRAEMKAKFAGSADRQDSALLARRRAEKLRSFNMRTAVKSKELQPAESIESEEEDLPEFSEQTQYSEERSLDEPLFGDASSRNTHPKKLLPNKSLSFSTPRTSIAPVPRSSVKATNSRSGRRRVQSENPLTQSVPNFSDFRKENTKPSTGISKTGSRSQTRNYARSKSTSEDISLVKEEKPRRSQSLRKSSASPSELKDLSPLNSDGVVLTPLRFSKEQSEQSLYNKIPKNGESKPFLRKGDGIGPGAGVGLAKLKASMSSENLKDGEESEEIVDQASDPTDLVREEDEFDSVSGETPLKAVDFPAESDNEKPSPSQESEKSGDPGSENGEVLRLLSQVDDDPAATIGGVSSKFNTSAGTVQNSPGESPASWNSGAHHSFSYTHEASDVDASVDSPMGSPASWNSHALTQMMEADAARMRKKWGSAQKPILVANASSHQSRKDMTKGFKRLLKFGRKSRGAESLITDWVSASTTSEGDDDTEDVRDPANRSSEDLRKSRMGFSQGHPPYEGFNEGEIFPEQVKALRSSIPAPPANFKLREDHLSGSSLKAPRSSFFSLSSFRSKGSESKPR
ncbi:uncharacterized protein LOC143877975 [Tasmannia lanceolata]|uniref:uncharacterized protein LOC143877975 n=1 Tax=Tasmannia lanceolata TaxID=3420 RepID=UPI004063B066